MFESPFYFQQLPGIIRYIRVLSTFPKYPNRHYLFVSFPVRRNNDFSPYFECLISTPKCASVYQTKPNQLKLLVETNSHHHHRVKTNFNSPNLEKLCIRILFHSFPPFDAPSKPNIQSQLPNKVLYIGKIE